MASKRNPGFTLVELLVVIGMIAVPTDTPKPATKAARRNWLTTTAKLTPRMGVSHWWGYDSVPVKMSW